MISIFVPRGIPIGELPETGEPSLSLPSLNIFPDLVLRSKFLSSVETETTLLSSFIRRHEYLRGPSALTKKEEEGWRRSAQTWSAGTRDGGAFYEHIQIW